MPANKTVIIMKKILKVIIILLAIAIGIGYIPLKFAKNPSDYSLDSDNYIICFETRVTGCDWSKILEFEGDDLISSYKNRQIVAEGFNFYGKSPLNDKFKLDFQNLYVVYGKHFEKPIEDEFYENISYTCEKWEILYPINRNHIFGIFMPRRYLCIFDLFIKNNAK